MKQSRLTWPWLRSLSSRSSASTPSAAASSPAAPAAPAATAAASAATAAATAAAAAARPPPPADATPADFQPASATLALAPGSPAEFVVDWPSAAAAEHEAPLLQAEVVEADVYFRHVPPLAAGAVVVDVGACVGLFSLRCRRAYPSCRVVAVEPVPATAACLVSNLSRMELGSSLRLGLGSRAAPPLAMAPEMWEHCPLLVCRHPAASVVLAAAGASPLELQEMVFDAQTPGEATAFASMAQRRRQATIAAAQLWINCIALKLQLQQGSKASGTSDSSSRNSRTQRRSNHRGSIAASYNNATTASGSAHNGLSSRQRDNNIYTDAAELKAQIAASPAAAAAPSSASASSAAAAAAAAAASNIVSATAQPSFGSHSAAFGDLPSPASLTGRPHAKRARLRSAHLQRTGEPALSHKLSHTLKIMPLGREARWPATVAPDEECRRFLARHPEVDLQGLLTVLRRGLEELEETERRAQLSSNSGSNASTDNNQPGPMAVSVPVVTLTQIARHLQLSKIDMLKIDCEGGELDVLRGMTEAVWAMTDRIAMEVESMSRAMQVVKLLQQHDFDVYLEPQQVSLTPSGFFSFTPAYLELYYIWAVRSDLY